jgi:hypothetical protein
VEAPESRFKVGDRVRISHDHHWAQGAFATISLPPSPVAELSNKEPWHGCWRHVKGVQGVLTFYWVWFDEEHDDGSGDEPYAAAEIEVSFLETVD